MLYRFHEQNNDQIMVYAWCEHRKHSLFLRVLKLKIVSNLTEQNPFEMIIFFFSRYTQKKLKQGRITGHYLRPNKFSPKYNAIYL
jgi:hypothetical protein